MISAELCHYTTKFNSERHKMPHFASRNTQHSLKTTSISTLFPQNPCTIQINALPLHRQSSPSLLTMLKSCEAFYFMKYNKEYSSPSELISILQSRGLDCSDIDNAIDILSSIFDTKFLLSSCSSLEPFALSSNSHHDKTIDSMGEQLSLIHI